MLKSFVLKESCKICKLFSCFSLGFSFHIAAQLGTDGTFAFDRIEDAIVQADEVDSRFLQFEGGLSITGIFLTH
jgi:oligosaccharyltransferase complex subunit delta (ribophorin II)